MALLDGLIIVLSELNSVLRTEKKTNTMDWWWPVNKTNKFRFFVCFVNLQLNSMNKEGQGVGHPLNSH